MSQIIGFQFRVRNDDQWKIKCRTVLGICFWSHGVIPKHNSAELQSIKIRLRSAFISLSNVEANLIKMTSG